MAIDPKILGQLEEMGRDTVRVRLEKFQGEVYRQAIEWLAQKDAEERERSDAFQEGQKRTASSANLAAWIAAIAAIIAAIVGIATIIVELTKK